MISLYPSPQLPQKHKGRLLLRSLPLQTINNIIFPETLQVAPIWAPNRPQRGPYTERVRGLLG